MVVQFQVGTVVLYGIPIVSLVIESQERLCLAQISNTLLKQFSYNEIHNRRVALGEFDVYRVYVLFSRKIQMKFVDIHLSRKICRYSLFLLVHPNELQKVGKTNKISSKSIKRIMVLVPLK